jgi:hypothetical protein
VAEDEHDTTILVGAERAPPMVFASYVANAARNVFGGSPRTTATEMAARSWVVKFMQNHECRPDRISRDLPLILELVFVPTEAQLRADWFRASHQTEYRRYESRVASSMVQMPSN